MSINQQILSRTRLEQIVLEFDLYAEERKTSIMEDVIEQMRNRDISVQIGAECPAGPGSAPTVRVSVCRRRCPDRSARHGAPRVVLHRGEPARPRGAC